MQEPLFKPGDTALLVTYSLEFGCGWAWRERAYEVVKIDKVHKTGRLKFKGSKQQWKRKKLGDYFVSCDRKTFITERLYPDTPELRAEIDAEALAAQKALKLNKLGDKLARLRDVESAASIWNSLPQEVRDMVEGEG